MSPPSPGSQVVVARSDPWAVREGDVLLLDEGQRAEVRSPGFLLSVPAAPEAECWSYCSCTCRSFSPPLPSPWQVRSLSTREAHVVLAWDMESCFYCLITWSQPLHALSLNRGHWEVSDSHWRSYPNMVPSQKSEGKTLSSFIMMSLVLCSWIDFNSLPSKEMANMWSLSGKLWLIPDGCLEWCFEHDSEAESWLWMEDNTVDECCLCGYGQGVGAGVVVSAILVSHHHKRDTRALPMCQQQWAPGEPCKPPDASMGDKMEFNSRFTTNPFGACRLGQVS